MFRDAICRTRPIFPCLAIGKSIKIINLLKGFLPPPCVDDIYFYRILFGSCPSDMKSPGTLQLLGGGKNILLLRPSFLYCMLRLFQEGNKGHGFRLPFFFWLLHFTCIFCHELRDQTSAQACPIITHREETIVKIEKQKLIIQIKTASEVSIWSYAFGQS